MGSYIKRRLNEIMKELKLDSSSNNTFEEINERYNNVFFYGKEVNDFHTLDKQKLFALNFSATQEIDRIQRVEKTKLEEAELKIATLEAENATLKTQIADILSRLQTLENA